MNVSRGWTKRTRDLERSQSKLFDGDLEKTVSYEGVKIKR